MYLSSSEEERNPKRNEVLDSMKGLGVYLVIMGHMQSEEIVGIGVWDYLYSFHMPLFFLISGYLFVTKEEDSFWSFFKRKVKSIWLPFTILFFASVIIHNVGIGNFSNFACLDTIIKGYLLSGQYLIHSAYNFPLWFLPHLFLASCLFYYIYKIDNMKVKLILLSLIICSIIPYQSFFKNLYCIWNINVLPVSLSFIGIGHIFKKVESKIPKFDYDWICLIIMGMFFAKYNPGGNVMKIHSYFYMVGAVCTVYGIYRILGKCDINLLKFAGKNSIITYGLHIFIMSFCKRLHYFYFSSSYTGMSAFLTDVFVVYLVDIVVCWILLWMNNKMQYYLSNIRKFLFAVD